ncbi:hypothetical protein [Thermohalobacter berrensis]|uniref:Uncharacterized protein n=1 Tax=Thermohalobacter berrensis TaxID=99594 RepID=A0A419T0S5_9FIRM|nr:hypothetical protein [Thermohalobacter berrensis]RKD31180.1 hypothetical protein BET03_03370 [Thermohalobacter berrensis]
MDNSNPKTPLDEIRIQSGKERLCSHFTQLVNSNPDKAIDYINDQNLSFTTLFLLKEQLKNPDILENLSPRNQIALETTGEILDKDGKITNIQHTIPKLIHLIKSTLIWILKTGSKDDGLDDNFDKLLDIVAIILIKVFNELDLLPLILDIIFKRYKEGRLIHDLVWAFYESRDPNCLFLIGKRLRSENMKEVELACDLLKFIPGIDIKYKTNKDYLYFNFINWFEENRSFLYFTGESFQQGCNPIPYAVSLEAKYLCETIPTNSQNIYGTLSSKEFGKIKDFNSLDDSSRDLLASFSCKMRRKNIHWWNSWINKSIEEQLRIARIRKGGI